MSGRFFRHGELPLVLLALFGEQPAHGYQAMAELQRLFGPVYRPSPGTVYPAIEALAAEGLIAGHSAADRTTWRLTDSGRQALADRAPRLAAIELRTGVRLGAEESLEAVLARFRARVLPLANRVDPELAARVLDAAADDLEALSDRRRPSRRSQQAPRRTTQRREHR